MNAPEGALTLDRLRDPGTGARLAPERADGDPVVGLPEGQTAPLVAIVDTGLDSSHPWVASTLFDSVDLTGQGEQDRNAHGTWVALMFLVGSPMPVGLLNVKALRNDGTGTIDALTRGIRWATRRGATSINVSAGVSQTTCRGDCPLCRAALDAASGGAEIFAAAGNTAGDTMCPAKAGLYNPGSGVHAGGAWDVLRWSPQPWSGIGAEYGLGSFVASEKMLPVLPGGGGLANSDPKRRAASASNLLRQAINADTTGLSPFAIVWLDEVTARWGDDGEPEVRLQAVLALVYRSRMLHRIGRMEDELSSYSSVIGRYGADPAEVIRTQVTAARFGRASVLGKLGDPVGALADYRAIVEEGQLSPGATSGRSAASALLRRGLLLQTLGRLQEASADLGAARDWYEKEAQAGDADAMVDLGFMLQGSDAGAAQGWYEKAAQAGQPVAMHNLAVLLKDSAPESALRWYEKAAQAGHASAMYNLGMMLEDSDAGAAQGWYEKAAQTGHGGAMYALGIMLEDSDAGAARDWYEQGAQAGHPGAMFDFGFLLKDSDLGAARGWYEKAAQAGHADAMYNLGVMLTDSEPASAQRWHQKAAQAGDGGAMYNLGVMLMDSDPGAARSWFEKAAEAGHAGAMLALANHLRG